MDEVGNIRSLISGELLKTYGQEILYAKDCQNLSSSILQKTKRRISVSTLKRLFGIIRSPYHPSKYTLDTIALYLNYRNWSEFYESCKSDQNTSSEIDYWSKLKSRIEIITNQSLTSIKAKLSDQLLDFQPREFAIRKFDVFLNSPYIATAFIAPGGYGKTTITTQLTELFFMGENARYPDDIVCLVDGSILVNLMNLNLEIVRIKNIIDFQERNSFSNYFRNNPDQVKGRFVLIIESLYQIYHQEERLKDFVGNLMDILYFYQDTSWFKCLITCRPENWKLLLNQIQLQPDFKNSWYDVNFDGSSADYINVPLLNRNEIDHFLKRRHSCKSYEKLKFLYPDITDLLNNPFILNLFCSIDSPKSIHSDLGILDYFFSHHILIEPYLEEKSNIIHAFVQHSAYAKKTYSVNKSVLPTSGTFNMALKSLISNNLLYEYSLPGKYLSVSSYVRFSNDILLGFFLANTWINENEFNLDLIREVSTYYETNPSLRKFVLKYLIKIAFRESNTKVLMDILPVLFSEQTSWKVTGVDQHMHEIIDTIGFELRKNNKMRKILIPHYARSEIGQLLFFERFFDMDSLVLHSGNDMDHYLKHKDTDEAKLYVHFTKFMQYFLAEERTNCKKAYDIIQSIQHKELVSPAMKAYSYSVQVLYHSCFEEGPENFLIQRIHEIANQWMKEGTQTWPDIRVFEYSIICALNFGNNFTEIIELYEWVQMTYKDKQISKSWKFQLCHAIYARALLNSGQAQMAKKVYKDEELAMVPVPATQKSYLSIQFNLIRIEFLILEDKIEEAQRIMEEIKTISQMLRFAYFYNKALYFEQLIANARGTRDKFHHPPASE